MSDIVLVSIIGRDRVGLVSAIADHLFAAGINLRDTTFATLGPGAEFTALCEVPPGTDPEALRAGLEALPELEQAQVQVAAYGDESTSGPMARITHRIEVAGADQLGLIARLADIFTQYGANIVRLNAQKQPQAEGGEYVTRFAVWLPPERAGTCLAAIANTAGSLRMRHRIEPVRAHP
jgi:glycine cleavage system transcriptional repressor